MLGFMRSDFIGCHKRALFIVGGKTNKETMKVSCCTFIFHLFLFLHFIYMARGDSPATFCVLFLQREFSPPSIHHGRGFPVDMSKESGFFTETSRRTHDAS